MVQVRKLVVAIAAASALSSGMAQALGLGELSVKSTLNQPLVAEIELTDARGVNASQLVPSLGTTADLTQSGVTRQAFLSDLTFTPVINPGGKSVLRITSSKPVRDPYVKFLVQVLWPNGRAQREYSLLLDPPKFSEPAAAPVATPAPVAAPARLPSVAPPVAVKEAAPPAAPAAPAEAPLPAPAVDKAAQYVTSSNDTLWEIAAKVRNGGTIQQTMLAIQALNPDAFVDGNINRLKKGQVLRLPTAQQAMALPQNQAVAEVAQQYRAWREGRRTPAGSRQVDATRRASAGAAPAQVEAKDNLSLVAASNKPASQQGAVADADLANKLAVTQESLDTSRRDNAELQSRMTDLQSQLDKLQRLIELKNDQLAKMQAGAAVPAVAANTAPLPATAVDATGAPITPAGEIAPENALPPEAAQAATPPAEQLLAVEPVAAQEADSDPFQALLNNPVMLGLVGGSALLLLALALLFIARRRRAKAEADKHKRMARALDEESQFVTDMDLNAPADSFDGLDVASPSYKMAPAAVAAAAANASRDRPTDPLVQAEIHIAYGRLNQAVELLEESVKHEPQRDDLRLKLMEIYAEQGNHKAFAAHERKLVASGKHEAGAGQSGSSNPATSASAAGVEPVVAASESKAALAGAAAVGVAAGASAAVMASELDAKYLEDLLADEEPEIASGGEPSGEPEQEDPDALDTDFDLSLDAFESASASEVVTLDDLDDLLADEPLSASSTADAAEPVVEPLLAIDEEPDHLADFDLDLGSAEQDLGNADDLLVDLGSEPLDLGASEPEVRSPDIELPEDFDLSLSDEIETDHATEAFASEIDDVNAELDRLSQSLEHPPLDEPQLDETDSVLSALDDEPRFAINDADLDDDAEFDFLSGTDEASTKLDLARAYIDMGDAEGARDILGEVVDEGNDGQKSEAREMLARLA